MKTYKAELQDMVSGLKLDVEVPAENKSQAMTNAILKTNVSHPGKMFIINKIEEVNERKDETQKPDKEFYTHVIKVPEQTLVEQMTLTDARRALNIANLATEKLKVVEARLSVMNRDFRQITDNAVERVKADARNELINTIREQVKERVDSRHLDDDTIHQRLENEITHTNERIDQLQTRVKCLAENVGMLMDGHREIQNKLKTVDEIATCTNRVMVHLKFLILGSRILRWLFSMKSLNKRTTQAMNGMHYEESLKTNDKLLV